MNRFGIRILVPFPKSVALSNIARNLFATTFNSRLYISIALCYAFAIACTFVAHCTSICTSMDNCSSTITTFSSLASFCTICASTKCCSTTSSFFDSSMNTGSTNVTPGLVYSLACQCHLLLCKNSIMDVPIVYALNYHLCKLYLLIIHLPFYTF